MNHDVDMSPLLISDWFHENPFILFESELEGNPPKQVSTLLQGQSTHCVNYVCTGSHHAVYFQQQTTYKMSIGNAGTSTQFKFWIDGHTFTVVGIDFVPIKGFIADNLNIGVGV